MFKLSHTQPPTPRGSQLSFMCALMSQHCRWQCAILDLLYIGWNVSARITLLYVSLCSVCFLIVIRVTLTVF